MDADRGRRKLNLAPTMESTGITLSHGPGKFRTYLWEMWPLFMGKICNPVCDSVCDHKIDAGKVTFLKKLICGFNPV